MFLLLFERRGRSGARNEVGGASGAIGCTGKSQIRYRYNICKFGKALEPLSINYFLIYIFNYKTLVALDSSKLDSWRS